MRALVVTSEQSKALDAYVRDTYSISNRVMIEVAGRSIAQFSIDRNLINKSDRILICLGSGHNGCDGMVLARHLKQLGFLVDILCCVRQLSLAISKELLKVCQTIGIPFYQLDECESNIQFLQRYTIVFDAITGTGFKGKPRPEQTLLAEKLEQSRQAKMLKIIAIDLPSFCDADVSPELGGTGVRADISIALQTLKKIHVDPLTIDVVGKVYVLDIGLPLMGVSYCFEVLTRSYAAEIAKPFFEENPLMHKGSKAKVIIFGGCEGKEGAAYLAALGGLRAGASLATIYSRSKLRFNLQIPEIMYEQFHQSDCSKLESAINNATSIVIGPGLGTDQTAQRIFSSAVEIANQYNKTFVIDADAIHLLSQSVKDKLSFPVNTIITPHPKEFLTLAQGYSVEIKDVEELLARRLYFLEEISKKTKFAIVLKGARSLSFYQGRCFLNPHATSSLAIGGSGDILSGIVAAIACRGSDLLESTALAVFVHGEAGLTLASKRSTPFGNIATDITNEIPDVISSLLAKKSNDVYAITPFQ